MCPLDSYRTGVWPTYNRGSAREKTNVVNNYIREEWMECYVG